MIGLRNVRFNYRDWLVYAVVLCVLSGSVMALALRSNNKHMIILRNKVYAADKANGDTEGALRELRMYVYGHMNTSLSTTNGIYPPLQLKYRYERLSAVEKQRVDAINAQIYTAAQSYCEQQNSQAFSGRTRVPCIEEYVTKHGFKQNPVPDELYKFDFVSPRWSPDLAGYSTFVFLLTLTLITLRGLDWTVGYVIHRTKK